MPAEAAAALEGAHLGIWTTTPWTIPANLAVAVNEALEYAVVEVQVGAPPSRLSLRVSGVAAGRAGVGTAVCSGGGAGGRLRRRAAQARAPPCRPSTRTRAAPAPAAVPPQGDAPEGWAARRLVVASDLAPALGEKFGVQLATLATLK